MLEVRGLTKLFGQQAAVSDLSFQVERGEIFGFIGPNGAGKTTTLRILATLCEPTSGAAFVDGHCVQEDTEVVRRIVGFMPDSFGVYEGVTVEEYLEFYAGAYRLSGKKRASVLRDVVELTDLGALRERMVADLSRGMKQRLCLAKTLIHDPKILLLDEPASALDPRARIELRALLKELGRMGKTIVISSHILTELSDLCTSVGIVERGRLVECGSMKTLERRSFGANRVRILLHADRPDVETILGGIPEVQGVRVDGCEVLFEYLGEPNDFHRTIKALVDHAVPILSVEQQAKNLEGLFLKVTRGDVQ
jgi:ABC-2 type transport system ATP-binding protein